MMKKEFGKDHLYSKIFIEDDKPYIISTIKNNGNLYNFKISEYISILNLKNWLKNSLNTYYTEKHLKKLI